MVLHNQMGKSLQYKHTAGVGLAVKGAFVGSTVGSTIEGTLVGSEVGLPVEGARCVIRKEVATSYDHILFWLTNAIGILDTSQVGYVIK